MGTVASFESNLKTVQNATLGIAREVDRICKDNNLSYSLIFGSLIGAVRHKGFIPWDDDIDIIMPRPDFEMFVKIAPDKLSEHFHLISPKMHNSERYVTRVVDDRLSLKLSSYNEGNVLPVWVDIFVLDGLPDNAIKRMVQYGRIYWHKALCAFAAFDTTVNRHRPGRPLWQQALIDICAATHFGHWLNIETELQNYDAALMRYGYKHGKDCCCGAGSYSPMLQTWNRTSFEELTLYEFEDCYFMGPKDYDSVLSVSYGDYMTLPPENERRIHNIDLVTT